MFHFWTVTFVTSTAWFLPGILQGKIKQITTWEEETGSYWELVNQPSAFPASTKALSASSIVQKKQWSTCHSCNIDCIE